MPISSCSARHVRHLAAATRGGRARLGGLVSVASRRRHLLAVAAERRHRRAHRVVVEVVLPVDLVDRRRVALDLGLGDAVDDRAFDRRLGRAGALELVELLLVAAHLVAFAAAARSRGPSRRRGWGSRASPRAPGPPAPCGTAAGAGSPVAAAVSSPAAATASVPGASPCPSGFSLVLQLVAVRLDKCPTRSCTVLDFGTTLEGSVRAKGGTVKGQWPGSCSEPNRAPHLAQAGRTRT